MASSLTHRRFFTTSFRHTKQFRTHANPQEVYSNPYLPPASSTNSTTSLLEYFLGHYPLQPLIDEVLKVRFRENINSQKIPIGPLTDQDVAFLTNAIQQEQMFSLDIDGLWVYGMVGMVSGGETLHVPGDDAKYRIFTQFDLVILYDNEGHIVQVDLSTPAGSLTEIRQDQALNLAVWVTFMPNTNDMINYQHRLERTLDSKFYFADARSFSSYNNVVICFFLLFMVGKILKFTLGASVTSVLPDKVALELYDRQIKTAKKSRNRAIVAPIRWKLLHRDVYRPAPNLYLLIILQSIGFQVVALVGVANVGLVALRSSNQLGHELWRQIVYSICFCSWAISPIGSGIQVGSLLRSTNTDKMNADSSHQEFVVCTVVAVAHVALCLAVTWFLNGVAMVYGAIPWMPLTIQSKLLTVYGMVSVPLFYLSYRYTRTNTGRRSSYPLRPSLETEADPPSRLMIPSWVLCLCSGLLGFACIYIELYYSFSSIFVNKFYLGHGTLAAAVVAFSITVAAASILIVFISFEASKNYRWQWLSFGSGASVGGYVLLHGIDYYFRRSPIHGMVQTSHYVAFVLVLATNISLYGGCVAHQAASVFVAAIYRRFDQSE